MKSKAPLHPHLARKPWLPSREATRPPDDSAM